MPQALLATWAEVLALPGLMSGRAAADNCWALMDCFERCSVACIRRGGHATPCLCAGNSHFCGEKMLEQQAGLRR